MTDAPASPKSDLDATLSRVGTAIAKRESAKVYQLTLWGDHQRGIPNEFTRSALFAAIPPNKARYVEHETVFSQKGFTVTFTGKRLTQSDLDVFEGVAHLARQTPEGNAIRFKAGALLRLIGRSTGHGQTPGKSQYQWLLHVLQRLTATSVAIERDGKKVFWGSLLPEGAAQADNGEFVVTIGRQLIQLFDRGFTAVEWEQRKTLTKKPLAQHLHGWILSHDKPFPVSVEYLRNISGSETRELKKFRQLLKAALNAIQETGAISAWSIDSQDRVHITR